MHAVPLDDGEDVPRLVVQCAGEPPRREFDPVLFQRVEFGVESGDVLRAVVVGEPPNAEPIEHLRALFGPALFRVEGDDAPRHEVRAGEEIGGLLSCAVRAQRQQ